MYFNYLFGWYLMLKYITHKYIFIILYWERKVFLLPPCQLCFVLWLAMSSLFTFLQQGFIMLKSIWVYGENVDIRDDSLSKLTQIYCDCGSVCWHQFLQVKLLHQNTNQWRKVPYQFFFSLEEIIPGPSHIECWIFLNVIIPLGKSAFDSFMSCKKQNANEEYLIICLPIRHCPFI